MMIEDGLVVRCRMIRCISRMQNNEKALVSKMHKNEEEFVQTIRECEMFGPHNAQ